MQSLPPVPQVMPVPVIVPFVGKVTVRVWRWIAKVAPDGPGGGHGDGAGAGAGAGPVQALRL